MTTMMTSTTLAIAPPFSPPSCPKILSKATPYSALITTTHEIKSLQKISSPLFMGFYLEEELIPNTKMGFLCPCSCSLSAPSSSSSSSSVSRLSLTVVATRGLKRSRSVAILFLRSRSRFHAGDGELDREQATDSINTCFILYQEDQVGVEEQISQKIWCPPQFGWVKINVDGAVSSQGLRADGGGVIRNHMGEWIVGFAQELGPCTVIEAEQMAMFRALNMAWDLGFRRITLESDCKSLVRMMNERHVVENASNLCLQLREFLSFSWELNIVHISRTQNMLADSLAKEGMAKLGFYDWCPARFRTLMSKDSLGFIPTSLPM